MCTLSFNKYVSIFMLQQYQFEEYLSNVIPRNYQGPWNKIKSEAEYNIHHQEHKRHMCHGVRARRGRETVNLF
jgi:hypothetical protein